MTEFPIDQSNLPRVQEVRRDFSVLEDGALAHCLQEQEIEQHYASNVQKNKLVQKDIRIAKKLQDEEDEQNKLRSLQKQRQIEERDSEYARVIQEELKKKAEECRRREEEDKEIAKRLQELEQEELQRRNHERISRNREHAGFKCHQRFKGEADNEEDDEYYFCQKDNNSPHAGNGRRTRRTPEQDHVWRSSKGHTTGTASAAGRIPSRDRSEERHWNSHRNVSWEARNDRRRDLDGMGHRSRTHSWDSSERTRGQHISEGECESRSSRSRSLREEGKQQCREEISKHHHEPRRHFSSKNEDSDELELRERNPHSHPTQGRQHHTQCSMTCYSSPRKGSHGLKSGDISMQPEHAQALEWQMAELKLGNSDQLLRDEELARRLQEEEEKQLTTSRHRGQNEDFRAAQVAQDEEIAKYMQHQELKSRRRSDEEEFRRESLDESSSSSGSSERRRRNTDERNEVITSHQVRLDSEGLASPREYFMNERPAIPSREGTDGKKQLVPRNIAEELDPTFTSKRKESDTEVFTGCPQEFPDASQPHAVPVDGFYDFMDDSVDPVFIPPTKRQPDKPGRQKSRDKKENCKQQ